MISWRLQRLQSFPPLHLAGGSFLMVKPLLFDAQINVGISKIHRVAPNTPATVQIYVTLANIAEK